MLITANLHYEAAQPLDYERFLVGRPVPTKDWIQIPKIYNEARRFKPDVVVTEMLRDPRWMIFGSLAPRISVRHDARPHDETHKRQWWIRSFDPWDARADGTIVFSEYVRRCMLEMGQNRSPIYLAPLLTDLYPALVPEFVPAERRRNFVLVGRQRPYKNHAVVFAAWEKHTAGPAYRGDELVLYGDGEIAVPLPPHSQWEARIFQYTELVDQYSMAKGSLVYSRSASQSGVQVASMQLGVAPIVSNAGGLPEYQPPGLSITGIDDVDGLAGTFDKLADPREAEREGRIALEHYASHYAPAVAAGRLVEIFEQVIRNRR